MQPDRDVLPTITDPGDRVLGVLELRRLREAERRERRDKWLCWLTAGIFPRPQRPPELAASTWPPPPAEPQPRRAAAEPPRRGQPRAARVEPDRDLPGQPPRLASPRAVPTATVLLAGAIGGALLASLLAVGLAARHAGGATQTSTTATASADPGPTGFAETVVAAWLGAGEDHHAQLEGLLAGPADLTGVPSGSFQALSSTALSATPLGPRYWSVLIAVSQVQRVVDPATRRASWQDDGTHYYRLGVYGSGGHYVATGPPGEVARPNPAAPPGLAASTQEAPDPADPRTDRVQRFLAAFLTGQGALDDSVAPGLAATPITPAPYAQVELRAVGYSATAGSARVTARATVAATTPTGNVTVLGYSLQLVRRDGRWYIAGLDGANALKPTTRSHP